MLSDLIKRSNLLSKYDVGETVKGLAKKLGTKPDSILKLNSNENFFVPLSLLRSLMQEVIKDFDPRIYPRNEFKELKQSVGRYMEVSPKQIVIGAGSDQLIDLICRAILQEGDRVLSITPTFSIYSRSVEVVGASYVRIPLKKNFALDVDNILASKNRKTKMVFLCSPNNPTANQFSIYEIERLIKEFGGIVVIDEAYVDFADQSVVDMVNHFENLVILRTFSKAFGLANLRIGYLVSNPKFSSTLEERFQIPYIISSISLNMGVKLLDKKDVIETSIRDLKECRGKLISRLNRIYGVKAFESKTNFVLIHLKKNSDTIYNLLLDKGIIVRNLGKILDLNDCIRVSVAPPPIMDKFVEELTEIMSDSND